MRYNTSCVTANVTDPGVKFEQVPDVIGIFISKFDIFKAGKTVYHIDRVIRETGEIQDNGLWEIYVNTKIDDGSDIAALMHIFTEKDAYDFEKFPKVSRRKKQFKESEGGGEEMCEAVENYARECAEEAAKEAAKEATKATTEKVSKETAYNFFKNGDFFAFFKFFFCSFDGSCTPSTKPTNFRNFNIFHIIMIANCTKNFKLKINIFIYC